MWLGFIEFAERLVEEVRSIKDSTKINKVLINKVGKLLMVSKEEKGLL